jgi:hypothetical protein
MMTLDSLPLMMMNYLAKVSETQKISVVKYMLWVTLTYATHHAIV